MKYTLGNTWSKKMQKSIEGFDMSIGIQDKKQHKNPKYKSSKSYAGGPARSISSKQGNASIGEIFIYNMKRMGVDLLREPFKRKSSNIIKFTHEFLKLAIKARGHNKKRVENLLQAVVRNPILSQDYGGNSTNAIKRKGFDRHLIDTSQLFRAIKAKVLSRV